ncbi:Autotransporter-associated beta strand repeat protein [Lacunisphaera limnophila]|uniref:Autotransporter-associated beta strand repeat protein n=1 Tax=Lacunisphaera limnophila TaxID=1838286 RepID=A0A1D8ARL6_9BACT|nr:autotransporter-associated beta strand repeat-containing protein [Lacunisphaera limnophila]AOS43538.1 Autotransporter-associated beta strand repeat protein [Lacunisphaera limnophila]
MKNYRLGYISLLLTLVFGPGMLRAQMLYTTTQVGTLGGTNSRATAVNDAGQVVGYSDVTGNGSYQAFVFTVANGLTNLGTPGGAYSQATDINASGQIVGYGSDVSEAGSLGFLYSGGSLSVLAGTNNAYAINNAGQITGAAGNSAYLQTGGSLTLLPKHAPEDSYFGTGINNSGTVVGGGKYYDPPGVFSPYTGSQFAVIGGTLYNYWPTGNNSAFDFLRVNDAGRVAGTNSQPGFGATYSALFGTANPASGPAIDYLFNSYVGGSTARDINNGNLVVGAIGYFDAYYTPQAYLYDSNLGGYKLLNSLTDISAAGFDYLNEAMGISDNGQIVGYGTTTGGQTRAFLLTPIAPFLYLDAGAGAGLELGAADWSTSAGVWATDPAGNNRGTWTNGAIAHFQTSSSASAAITLTDSLSLEGAILSNNANVTVTPAGTETLTFTGQAFVNTEGSQSRFTLNTELAGSAGLWKTGSGTLHLGAANTYTGQTRVSTGDIEISHDQALGATGTGNETVLEGGRVTAVASLVSNEDFIMRGGYFDLGMQSAEGRTVVFNGGIRLETTGYLYGANRSQNSTLTVNGVITEADGPRDLFVDGATLAGANTFTGRITTGGEGVTVAVINADGVAGPLGAGTGIALGYQSEGPVDGALRYTGGTATVTRTIQLEGGAGTIDVTNGATTLTLAGLISGGGTLAKDGAGVLAIGTPNTFTGGTRIDTGTLRISGSGALGTGSVAIGLAGTLTGSGDVTGDLNVDGTFEPGDSLALVSVSGNLTLGLTGSLRFDLGGLVRGTEYDAINLGGTFGSEGTIRLALINGFMPGAGDSFNLLDWGNTGSVTFQYFDTPTLTPGLFWDTSLLATTGVISVTDMAPIPEPSTYAGLAGLAALGLALWRRKKTS